ncbi:MAG: LTA synthase family protein [Eubacteriales bacterium]
MKLNAIMSKIHSFGKINEIRAANENKFHLLKVILTVFYPLFIIVICELSHFQSLSLLSSFFKANTNVLMCVILFESALYITMLFLTRSAFITATVNSIVMFTFACVDYYKYLVSGTHFTVSDIAMAGDVSDISRFANIKVSAYLVLLLVSLIAYSLTLFLLNVKIKLKFTRSLAMGFVSLVICVCMITVPVISMGIYEAFDVDDSRIKDYLSSNDRFERNGFYAFFLQSATDIFKYAVQTPGDYGYFKVKELLKEPEEVKPEVRNPNVIFVMSESYADFRGLQEQLKGKDDKTLDIPSSTYADFDKVADEGFTGHTIVPTFGGYTVRSEFELIFGLPVRSLNTPAIPHYMFPEKDGYPTMADLYKDNGYTASYIHPFSSTFYKRDEIYPLYDFDNLVFDKDFKTSPTYYNGFVDDASLFNEIINTMESTAGPDYIMSTSMQNHMPYLPEGESGGDSELAGYLKGITLTNKSLLEFTEKLTEFKEPVILVFCGDHFPFFTQSGNAYDKLGLDESNSYSAYNQEYILWNNYGSDYTPSIGDASVSAFYLPHIAAQMAGIKLDSFSSTMLSAMKNTPVYSANYKIPVAANHALDLLTYDRVFGDEYSS